MRRTAQLAGLAVASAVVLSGLSTAAAAPPASPTGPSAALPGKVSAAAVPGEVIIKDTSSGDRSCTGFSSQATPPATIRVLITSGTPQVATVPFEQYVENVLPNEWISSWDGESLKAGAVAVKSYAWFWVNHFGGYLKTRGNCFDVTDDTAFQVYRANSGNARTNSAVQQTWNVIARGSDHQVRQTFYICSLPYKSGTTNCGVQGPKEKCGASANGSQLSQYGSQACAAAGFGYQDILRKYYNPGLELATVRLGPVSALPAGPVQLARSGVLVAYRMSGGAVLATQQATAGSRFGPWSVLNGGPQFAGQPAALVTTAGALAVYARTTSGRILGDGQSRPGAAFNGWQGIGSGSPVLSSDPTPLVAASGALVVYARAVDGNIWGTGQASRGSSFGPWVQLSTGGGFTGRPAALITATGQIAIYARNGSVIQGAGQSVPGGRLSPFGVIGSGALAATGDPSVLQAGDGTLSVFAGGASTRSSGIWAAAQPSPGRSFGSWQQISASASYTSAPATHAMTSSGPITVYAVSTGTVQGSQAATPGSAFSAFRNMGAGSPGAVGNPSIMIAASGALGLYAIGADGALWGCGQSRPGSTFGGWGIIGS